MFMSSFNLAKGLLKTQQALVYGIRAAVLALAATALLACGSNAGTPAAQVQFKTIAGQQFDTASLKGKVTLINFWATSCTTCVKEMPMLTAKFNAYQSQGYRMVAVAMDYDQPQFIQAFTKERALPFDVVHDVDGKIAQAFGNIKLTPTTFLIDKQGNIAKRYVGEPKPEDLKAAIEGLLKA